MQNMGSADAALWGDVAWFSILKDASEPHSPENSVSPTDSGENFDIRTFSDGAKWIVSSDVTLAAATSGSFQFSVEESGPLYFSIDTPYQGADNGDTEECDEANNFRCLRAELTVSASCELIDPSTIEVNNS